jgi:alkylation response protein AidB-like acyl-CoA dehydrogenase
MPVSRYRAPLADLQFLLDEVLHIGELFKLPDFAHADRDIVRGVLEEGARFAEQKLAPANAISDLEGARLQDGRVLLPEIFHHAWDTLCQDGWLGIDLPLAYGGQALPRLLQAAFAEMTNGACMSFCMLPLMSRAGARLLLEHATPALIEQFVPALAAGETTATICISEPQAGSDVGRIQTRAIPAGDGTFRLSGSKIWISYGDHDLTPQIAHMVLARTPDAAPGTRGTSLFLVPKLHPNESPARPNGIRVQSIEQKMGLKGSPTCVLEFDDALAWPIGPEGRGLASLFTMVNTMRLEVALQGVAIAGAATAQALRYATERHQGGPSDAPPVAIIRHPDVRRMLLTMRARTEGLRALTLEAARQLDLAEHHPDADPRQAAGTLADWLLPICKACATEAATEVSNLGIQVHGGYGYVRETGMEQYVRDARVGAIYEGTNGIQALDLVQRKLIRDGGKRLQLFIEHISADLTRTVDCPHTASIHQALMAGLKTLQRCAQHLLQPTLDPRDSAAAATPFLKLAGLIGSGWMWLRMAATATGDSALHQNKRSTAAFFAEQLMPESGWLEQQILAGVKSLDAVADDVLSEI